MCMQQELSGFMNNCVGVRWPLSPRNGESTSFRRSDSAENLGSALCKAEKSQLFLPFSLNPLLRKYEDK